MIILRGMGLAFAAIALPAALHAQRTCPNGAKAVGDYGLAVADVRVLVSELHPDIPGDTRVRFGTELVVRELRPGSAGDGILKPGDIITAVDGLLITTFEGSRRISHPPIDQSVKVTVRRNGEERRVTVFPRESCMTLFGPALVPREQRDMKFPEGVWKRVGDAGGWLGIRFECAHCSGEADTYREQLLLRDQAPRVLEVAPGSPAAQAGVQKGDVLVRVDEHAVPGSAAHLRLGTIMPGERIRLRFMRGERVVDAVITAAAVPAPR